MTKRNLVFVVTLILILGLTVFGLRDAFYIIGGDVMLPVIPSNNLFKINMWYAGTDSMHYLHFFWYSFYYVLEILGVSVLHAQKILILLSTLLAFIFSYKLFMELPGVNKKDYLSGILVSTLYVFTPAVFLVVPGYLPLYGVPICTYYFVRYLKSKRLSSILLFSFLVNAFFFVDLPQPKILVSYIFFLLFILSIYYKNYFDGFKDLLLTIIKSLGIFIVTNAFIFFPLVYTVFSGDLGSVSENISSHNGDADLGSASLLYLTRFFNTSAYIGYNNAKDFLLGLPFVIISFLLYFLIIYIFHLKKYRSVDNLWYKNFIYLLLVFFVAKGSNPPFGGMYRYLIENIPPLSIFRTTANIVILGLFPFSVLVVLSIQRIVPVLNKSRYYLIFFLLIVTVFHPTLTGARYYNHHNSPQGKGVHIPEQYFDAVNFLNNLNISNRVLLLPFPDGYVYKNWDYFGPDIISWMSNQNFVYRSGLFGISTKNGSSVNNSEDLDLKEISKTVPYIIFQKDAVDSNKYKQYIVGDLIYSNEYIDIYENKLHRPQIDSRQSLVNYVKVNPTLYNVSHYLKNNQTSLVTLYENYNKDWRICYKKKFHFIDYKQCLEPNKGPYNSWDIDPQKICKSLPDACVVGQIETKLDYTIEFWPQNILYLGFIISLMGTITIVALNKQKHV